MQSEFASACALIYLTRQTDTEVMGRIGMREGLVAGFLLLIALVLAIAFQQDGPAKPIADPVESPSSEPSAPELERVSLRQETAPTADASRDDPEPDREPPTHFTVRVVDGRTGKAVPDQEVLFANWLRGRGQDFEKTMRAQGRSLRTNDSGSVTVPLKGRRLSFFARKGNLTGQLIKNWGIVQYTGKDEATLELHPERAITVRVVDQEGNPVPGMKVQFSFGIDPTFSQRVRGEFKEKNKSEWAWRELGTSSDPDGTVEWKNLGDQLRELREGGKRVAGIVMRVVYPGTEQPDLVLSPPPAHGSFVELMLPILGELTIKLVDKHDRPLAGTGRINLQPLTLDREEGTWYGKRFAKADFEAGIAEIPSIALDSIYEASVYLGRMLITKERILGPKTGEKDAERKVVCDSEIAFLRGRAVDASGQVLVDRKVYSVGKHGTYHLGASGKTDSQGEFLLALQREVIGLDLAGYAIRDVHTQSTVDLSSLLPIQPGIHELGDVVFPESVSLLRGRVLPAKDAPCDNWRALLQHRAEVGGEWTELAYRLETEGDEFEIFGPLLLGTYRLTVIPRNRCHLPVSPVEFVPGTRDFSLQLERGQTLTVHAQLPIEAEEYWIRHRPFYELLIRPEAGNNSHFNSEDALSGIRPSGLGDKSGKLLQFHWNGLVEGSYVLEARIQGADTPFLVSPVFKVSGTGTTHQELDLRTALKRVTLSLRSAAGSQEPVSGPIRLIHDGRVMRWPARSDGDAQLVVVPGAFDAWVLAPGYAPKVIERISEDQVVLLEPSDVSLTVQLAKGVALPPGFDLLVHLKSVSSEVPGWESPNLRPQEMAIRMSPISPFEILKGGWQVESQCVLVDGDPVQVRVKRAGEQMLRLELVPNSAELRSRMKTMTIPIEEFSPASIGLEGTTSSRLLKISITQSAIDAALEKAGLR